MRFYTNVQMVGNNFLVRGYEDGKKVIFKEEYAPTLFVKSKRFITTFICILAFRSWRGGPFPQRLYFSFSYHDAFKTV